MTHVGVASRVIRHGQQIQENMRYHPEAVDILCQNTSGSAITGNTTDGYKWVRFDFANYSNGGPVPIKLTTNTATEQRVLGVIVDGQNSVADDGLCWVRIWGKHSYAALEGTATTGANVGALIETHGTDGIAKVTDGTTGLLYGYTLEAYETVATAAKQVFISNPSNFVIA